MPRLLVSLLLLAPVALAGWGASHDVAAMAGFVVVLLTFNSL